MNPTPPLVTAKELLRMPRGRVRRALIRGRVIEYPLFGGTAGMVAANVIMSLGTHVYDQHLGTAYSTTGYLLESDPDTVLGPAVSFVGARDVSTTEEPDGYIIGPPDLAVEIVSFTDRDEDLAPRIDLWRAAGCAMLVVVDPEPCTAKVYRPESEMVLLGADDIVDGGDVVPGWRLPVRDLFI